MAKRTHKHNVTTEWSTPGYFGRAHCVCCGFHMIGENRILTVANSDEGGVTLCDGCVNAIATEADGKEVYADGVAR